MAYQIAFDLCESDMQHFLIEVRPRNRLNFIPDHKRFCGHLKASNAEDKVVYIILCMKEGQYECIYAQILLTFMVRDLIGSVSALLWF